MKKIAKLAFDLLEKELETIKHDALVNIKGGNSGSLNMTYLPPGGAGSGQVLGTCAIAAYEVAHNYLIHNANGMSLNTALENYVRFQKTGSIDGFVTPADLYSGEMIVMNQGVTIEQLVPFLRNQFNNTGTILTSGALAINPLGHIATAIDAGHPLMASINGGTHEVVLVGYNSGFIKYYDPQDGNYKTGVVANFSNVFELGGAN